MLPHLTEEWRPVSGYEDWYSVSNLGRVRRDRPGPSTYAGKLLAINYATKYPSVGFSLGRARKFRTASGPPTVHAIHRLVALAFFGPRLPGYEVNHKDGNKRNNSVDNLEYVTRSENHLHAYRTGLRGKHR